jgi:hypothetical protein
MRVSNISGNKVTFEVQKCDGSTFKSGTEIYLKESSSSVGEEIVCGSQVIIISNAGGSTTLTKTITVSHTGRLNYVATTVGNTDRYMSNIVAIDGTAAPTNQAPTKPSNPTPANGATGVSTSPTFSWNSTDPEGGQVYYKFWLGTIENTLTLEKSGTGTTTSMSNLNPGTTYYWCIESSDSQGKIGMGPTWRFTTAGQQINPVLSLSSSTVVMGNSLTVSGSSFTANNKVYLLFKNGTSDKHSQYVNTNSSGSFSFDLDPTLVGVGNITVTATDYSSGKQVSKNFTVTAAPSPSLTVSPSSSSGFPSSGGTENLTVTSNVSWTASSNQSWARVSPSSGSGNGSIQVTIDPNQNTSTRTATITVSGGGITKTPTITQAAAPVTQSMDSLLKTLTVSPGTLSPNFSPYTTTYTVQVANNVSSITVAATANHAKATVSGAGAKSLAVGVNTFQIKVTAEAGNYSIYTIKVTRAAALSSDATLKTLTVSQGTLSPGFSPTTVNYTVQVANNVSSITVAAAANHAKAKVTGDTGTKSLAVGENPFQIKVTAENGSSQIYTVKVTRATAVPVLEVFDINTGYTLTSPLSFPKEGGTNNTKGFTVKSNVNIKISSTGIPGITITPTVEEKAGLRTFPVGVVLPINNTGKEREATVTVSGGGVERKISIFQAGADNETSSDFTVVNGILMAYKGTVDIINIPSSVNNTTVTGISSEVNWGIPEKIRSIKIPKTVTNIGYGAFSTCEKLSVITVEDGTKYSVDREVLYELQNADNKNNGRTLHTFPAGVERYSYTIPEGVIKIASRAFYNSNISQITIPNAISDIGQHAFSYCENLITVTMQGKIPPGAKIPLAARVAGCVKQLIVPTGSFSAYYNSEHYSAYEKAFCNISDHKPNEVTAQSSYSDSDNTGNVGVSLVYSENEQYSGNLVVHTPAGVEVDAAASILSDEFSNSHTLNITPVALNSWEFNITPNVITRSGGTNSYRDIVNIVYRIYEPLQEKDNELIIHNVLFYNDNAVIQEDEIKVSVLNPVANEPQPQPEKETLSCYPNPVDNTLTVKIPNLNREKAVIRLFNLSGQTVYQDMTEESQQIINVQSLKRGIYILQVKVGNETYTEKVIKK